MAVEISDGGSTPHATNYSDLLAKLKTFLLAQGWTSVASLTNEEYLKGPGSGSDNIYVGIQKFADVPNDNYAWVLQGLTGYVPATSFNSQPGAIPSNPPALALWNSTIPYWFVANGRRFIVVAKVSTLYMSAYCGWMLPYAIPASQWPYPLVIGGSTYAESNNNLVPLRYSGVNGKTSNYMIPINTDSNAGQLCLRDPSGTWQRPVNRSNAESTIYNYWDGEGVWPWSNATLDDLGGFNDMEKSLDGNYSLQPAIPHLEVASRNVYGELDGVFHAPGRGQSAENIIQRGGVDHLVIQNVFRTAKDAYAAIKLS
jgi:hypothetical protein